MEATADGLRRDIVQHPYWPQPYLNLAYKIEGHKDYSSSLARACMAAEGDVSVIAEAYVKLLGKDATVTTSAVLKLALVDSRLSNSDHLLAAVMIHRRLAGSKHPTLSALDSSNLAEWIGGNPEARLKPLFERAFQDVNPLAIALTAFKFSNVARHLFTAHYLDLSKDALIAAEDLASLLQRPNDTLYIPDDCTFAIGHMAVLFYICVAVELKLIPSKEVVVIGDKIANKPFFAAIQKRFPFLKIEDRQNGSAPHILSLANSLFGRRILSLNNTPHTLHGFCDAVHRHLASEDEAGQFERVSLLQVPESDLVWKLRKRWPNGFVTVLARSFGFNQTLTDRDAGVRNADIKTYQGAFELLSQRGIGIVRLGDKNLEPIGDSEWVYGYAHSDEKSPLNEISLIRGSEFMIECSSGLGIIAQLIGVPVLFLNFAPLYCTPWTRQSVIVMKSLMERKTQTKLNSLDYPTDSKIELLAVRYHCDRLGIDYIDLTEDQVTHCVRQYLALRDGSDSVFENESDCSALYHFSDSGLRPVNWQPWHQYRPDASYFKSEVNDATA